MSKTLYVARAGEYFATVIDIPHAVDQAVLDDLKYGFEATDSPDFSISTFQDGTGNNVRTGRLFSLPFRLSMGLHETVPSGYDVEATEALFDTYRRAQPLYPRKGTTARASQHRHRAETAVVGALLEASTEKGYTDLVVKALKIAKAQGILSWDKRSLVTHSLDLHKRV